MDIFEATHGTWKVYPSIKFQLFPSVSPATALAAPLRSPTTKTSDFEKLNFSDFSPLHGSSPRLSQNILCALQLGSSSHHVCGFRMKLDTSVQSAIKYLKD